MYLYFEQFSFWDYVCYRNFLHINRRILFV